MGEDRSEKTQKDLQRLSGFEMFQEELKDVISNLTSQNGGELAPNADYNSESEEVSRCSEFIGNELKHSIGYVANNKPTENAFLVKNLR